MIPVCPFAGASRPDDATLNKPYDENKQQAQESKPKKESGEVATVSPKCPFGYDSTLKKPCDDQNKQQDGQESKPKQDSGESATMSPKCPFGYDSQAFKLGPFSCMICQALLYESSRCVPCSHVFCK